MNRITDSKLDLSNSLWIDNRICDSEASNYIKYRLGLFPKGSDGLTKYSKEKYIYTVDTSFLVIQLISIKEK